MILKLFTCNGGDISLPASALIDRQDGGNLLIHPSREVWERSELTPIELMLWSFLVAATGQAMLEVLSQLEGGCINYWEAGNWGLNDLAEPQGPKNARAHRKVHMHLLGRSRTTTNSAVKWGEAPKFPDYINSSSWTAKNEKLSADECQAIVEKVDLSLKKKYGMHSDHISTWSQCVGCGYPSPMLNELQPMCKRCQKE